MLRLYDGIVNLLPQASCLDSARIESVFVQNLCFWGTSKGEMLVLAHSTIGDRVKFC